MRTSYACIFTTLRSPVHLPRLGPTDHHPAHSMWILSIEGQLPVSRPIDALALQDLHISH